MDPAEIPLRDIHLPDPVSWWPLAPGWWWLIGIVLLLVTAAAVIGYRRRRGRIVHAARAEFDAISTRYAQTADPHELVRQLSRLARRCALALEPDRAAAAATGAEWQAVLARVTTSGAVDDWLRNTLVEAPYRRHSDVDGARLVASFDRWLTDLRKVPERAS
jgi:hypothetical protein